MFCYVCWWLCKTYWIYSKFFWYSRIEIFNVKVYKWGLLLTNGDCLFMLLNHLEASEVFFHWFTFALLRSDLLILSKICLLILPISDFDGLMSLNDEELGNPYLRSFTEIKASISCNCWILPSNFSFSATLFSGNLVFCQFCVTPPLFYLFR